MNTAYKVTPRTIKFMSLEFPIQKIKFYKDNTVKFFDRDGNSFKANDGDTNVFSDVTFVTHPFSVTISGMGIPAFDIALSVETKIE